MKFLLPFLLAILSISIYPQQYTISGRVIDRETRARMSFANIRVAGSTIGTAANIQGEYELKLQTGTYKLIASYIGYYSDTIEVKLNQNLEQINFRLLKSRIDLPEVVVKPGENPALEIIRKAIEKKKARNEKLNQYEFEAYTKGTIRTTEDISAGRSSVTLGIGGSDTTELKITGILENHSKGYYKKPNQYKEIILARKQSANFPPTLNTLTGGRLIQNFYSDDINLFGRDLPGPLADNALNYYYFYIEKTLAINDIVVYQIFMSPDNSADPGFEGSVFITDSTFDLIKVDLRLNRSANTGGIFETINIFQQFDEYDNVFMPVDYRLFVTANVLGLARIGFEINTILFDYKINPVIPADRFDLAIVTVIPDADKRDSTYWIATQTIPSTNEELEAYQRIDSLENVPRKFLDDFNILSTRLRLLDKLFISAPLGLYHFNRVEGHALDFGFFLNDVLDQRLNSQLKLAYGFSDKKLKKDLSATYLFGDYRTYSLKLNAYDRLNVLFGESENYNEITATLLALIAKEEFRDYYYSNGWDIKFSGEVFPVLNLELGFMNRTDNSAISNSNFAFFYKDRTYRQNPPIYETKINALTAGFKLDFRNYIEDGYFRRRTSLGRSFITFAGDVTYSNKDFLNSGVDFTTYKLSSNAFVRTFRSAVLNVRAFGMYNDGALPYQYLYALPGNINLLSADYSFRTLNVNDIFGEKVFTLNLEHNFRDELFKMLRIPILKDIELTLNTFFNVAVTEMGEKSSAILLQNVKTFPKPFYEIGFGIGQVLLPLKIEFAWKLNYRGENNFRVGINSFVF